HTRCLDDGRFCTPAAFCDVVAGCVTGADPCPAGLLCDEANQRCVECFAAADCDDADPCTLEACVGGACSHTADTNCQGGVGGAARDFDGDGIVDELDRCPETPQGVPVNALGCQMSVPPPPPVAAPLPVDNARPESAASVDRGQPPAGRSSAGSSVCGVTGMIHFLVILTCLHLMSGRVWGQPAGREARRYGLKDAFSGHPAKTGNFLKKPCKKSGPTQT
ncbi:MAG: hypothetical protein ACE5GE_17600, partial [Phycisphaerae bacterium]